METQLVKRKVLLPVFAAALAVGGAFASVAQTKTVNSLLQNGRPVQADGSCGNVSQVACSTGSNICTISGVQYKDEDCTEYLKQP